MNEKNKIKLDVVIIATLRPEILDITLNTFYHRLLNNFNCRLIVNIDPIGDQDCNYKDIIRVCKKYFKNIVYNAPKKPSFAKAVFWCWKKVQTDIFFHLEDDWCLKSLVDKKYALKPFFKKNTVQVRLNIKKNKQFLKKNGDMHTNIFSLNPSFFRTIYIKEKLEKFNFNLDPEKQIRYNLQSKSFNKPKLVLYGIQYQNSMIIDIGKIFREMASFEKWDSSQIGSTSWKIKKLKFYMSILLKIKYTLYLIILKLRYCS